MQHSWGATPQDAVKRLPAEVAGGDGGVNAVDGLFVHRLKYIPIVVQVNSDILPHLEAKVSFMTVPSGRS